MLHLLVSKPFNSHSLIEEPEILFRKSNPWKTEYAQAIASNAISDLVSNYTFTRFTHLMATVTMSCSSDKRAPLNAGSARTISKPPEIPINDHVLSLLPTTKPYIVSGSAKVITLYKPPP
jgi:hypothetical protein